MARKPGRPKSGSEILSRERILTTALELVDHHGVDALSMRRLATQLGVDPMAIYRHLPDKAAVMAGMVEQIFDNFHIPTTPGQDWREQIRAIAQTYRARLGAHPNLIVPLVKDMKVAIPVMLIVGETLATTLHSMGLTPLQIVTASNLIVDYLHGYALGESNEHVGLPGQFDDLYALLNALPADQYPAMRALYTALDEATMHAHADDSLELILDGISMWVKERKGEQ